MEKFDEGTQVYLNRLTQSLEKLQSNSVSQNTLTTSETNEQETLQEVRLPTIDLPHFHGRDDENFECYWKTFDSLINSKKSISKPNKFLYLQSTLEGKAKAVVEHLIPGDKDYDSAIQLLEVNYSNKEIAIANLYYKLRAIPTPDTTPDALQEFRLQVESLIKVLGVKADVPKADWVLKLEIQSKFAKKILASICSHYRTDILSLDEIFEGLRITVNRLRAHEKIISDTDKSANDKLVKSKVTSKQPNKSKTATSTPRWKNTTVGTYTISPCKPVAHKSPKLVTPTSTTGRRCCLFCQERHTIYQCQNFPDRVSRIKRLTELHKCTRCLLQHDPNTCTTPLHICNRCHQDQHHSALCGVDRPKSPKLQVEQDTSTIVQCCKVRQEVKVLNTKSRNNVVLPIAQLQLNSKNSKITTRGLFDQGSQRTFITQQAANQLKLKPLCKVTLNISGFLADTGPQEFEVFFFIFIFTCKACNLNTIKTTQNTEQNKRKQ
ncbi:uncharacterized protein [Procambarus clarkii]|uniref:uncharacterized protein n=1 Tax=Procambarus clarkii TaxID=6728 RepID=UPI003743DA1B